MTPTQVLARFMPYGRGPTMTAFYGPEAKQARRNVVAHFFGEPVPLSNKLVQCGNWREMVAEKLGITTFTCLADLETQINLAVERELNPLPASSPESLASTDTEGTLQEWWKWFTFEKVGGNFRVSDPAGRHIATCYSPENAKRVVDALNASILKRSKEMEGAL